ncbi:hypothetical protein GUJ93_ZPchr0002g23657 [Zizania palustris]|uniref:Uncharacterized protein n=1 Tax=Zizania palustris TaxID=103762 RepID=A0A8J5SCI0_ZIZPA|nr:hypothetical protein GUJ93_ZPchr0002g23657 [Zizania palustris]
MFFPKPPSSFSQPAPSFNPRFSPSPLPRRLLRATTPAASSASHCLRPPPRPPATSAASARLPSLPPPPWPPTASTRLPGLPPPPPASAHLPSLPPPPPPPQPPATSAYLLGLRCLCLCAWDLIACRGLIFLLEDYFSLLW